MAPPAPPSSEALVWLLCSRAYVETRYHVTVRVHRFTTCEKILVVTAKVFRLVVSFDACFGLAEKDLLEQDETINSELDDGVFEVYFNLISFRFLSKSHDSSLMMEVTKIRPCLVYRKETCSAFRLKPDYTGNKFVISYY